MSLRLLLPFLPLAVSTAQGPTPADVAAREITATSLASSVRFLSSDLFEGRGPGTRGDLLARTYLQSEFERCGLKPAGDDGTFQQKVPMLGITTTVASELFATTPDGKQTLQLKAPDDYTALAGSPDASAEWKGTELVFVGYGITAPEQQWDDFKGLDVRGKVLLVMNNDPADDPALFAGKTRLYYGRWSYKYEEAARRGAIGAIVIHTTPSAGYPYQVVQANHGRENIFLPFGDQPRLPIRSWCTEDAAKKLCAIAGKDLDALRAAAEKRDFKSVPLGVHLDLKVASTLREFASGNALGMLPGSDPARAAEVVVVTAHFDHLGKAPAPKNGDDIYNGALDNASGLAGMLALMRACAALEPRPARSILFAAVTAEESGLLGSEWLANHLPCDRKLAIANYNIDGLNIWGPTEDLEFIGHGKSSLTALAAEVARAHGRHLEPDTNPDLGLFYRSDHFNFARIGVPAAYFKGGNDFVDRREDRRRMKASYTATHYHQVTDELAPWWNFEGAVQDVRILFDCVLRTAAEPAPTWTPGDEFASRR